MKRTIVIAALAVAGVVVAAQGEAAAQPRASHQVAGLTRAVRDLRTQLAHTKAKLTAAERHAAALQSKLDAIPTPRAVAEKQVRREVAYATSVGLPHSQGELVSLAAMDYVEGHISMSAYGYETLMKLPHPLFTPDAALGAQAGICYDAALTFAAIVQHFGYRVRSAEFWYTDPAPYNTPDTHIAVEVYYAGGWHFFDPTFGAYWADADGKVISITEARAGGAKEVKDEASLTNIDENHFYGDSTAFETDPATGVKLGRGPFVAPMHGRGTRRVRPLAPTA